MAISKFRNVFGELLKDSIWTGIKASSTAWDGRLSCVNSKWLAFVMTSIGAGAVCVLPADRPEKVGTNPSTIRGHSRDILDIAFDPFDEDVIATAGDDGAVKIWRIPEGGIPDSFYAEDAFATFHHERKAGCVVWHPTAKNIIATAGQDGIRVWNIDDGSQISHYNTPEQVNSITFNLDGSKLAASCKDKHLYVINPRSGELISSVQAHEGAKGFKAVWCTNFNIIITCGFGRPVGREIKLWNVESLTEPLHVHSLDQASSLFLPAYDPDTCMLYMTGKGEGIIRYFEVLSSAPYLKPLSEFVSNVPARGMCVLPKGYLDLEKNEVMRIFKLTERSVEPVSFKVPRRAAGMDKDIFPATFAGKASLTAEEWVSGKDSGPVLAELDEQGLTQQTVEAEEPPVVEQPKEEPKVETEPVVEAKNPAIFDETDSEEEVETKEPEVEAEEPVTESKQPEVEAEEPEVEAEEPEVQPEPEVSVEVHSDNRVNTPPNENTFSEKDVQPLIEEAIAPLKEELTALKAIVQEQKLAIAELREQL
ncbi:hypothetical protein GEMRC1_004608 [Eukaryota sp. GEM-RC1]